MKFLIALCLLLAAVTVQSLNNMNNGPKVCVIHANTCNSNVSVCGRYGRSNLCKRFKNNCALQMANCAENVGYTAVDATRCRGIALNQRSTCSGVAGTTAGSGILSTLFGDKNKYSVQQPIVINTGK